MDRRAYVRFGLAALAAVAWFGVQPCYGQDRESDAAVPAGAKAVRRDPVAEAFAIPYGTVLNEKQRAEYDRLKTDNESAYRAATSALAAAGTPDEKADRSSEVIALRREIRTGIRQILLMPYYEARQARQLQAMQQANESYGPSGYSANYSSADPGSYGNYYNGMTNYGYPYYGYPYYAYPYYGYPLYVGWPEWYYGHRHHHHYQGNTLASQRAGYPAGTAVVTHTAASVKTGGTQVARHTTAAAATRPAPAATPVARPAPAAAPAAKPASRPAPHATPPAHPAKHH